MFHQKITYPNTLQSRPLSIPCHHLLRNGRITAKTPSAPRNVSFFHLPDPSGRWKMILASFAPSRFNLFNSRLCACARRRTQTDKITPWTSFAHDLFFTMNRSDRCLRGGKSGCSNAELFAGCL